MGKGVLASQVENEARGFGVVWLHVGGNSAGEESLL